MQETKGSERTASKALRLYPVLVCIISVSLLCGCAKFSTSRKMDAGPFGENITILMGDIAADIASNQPFHIKRYMNGPSLTEYQAEWASMRKIMRGVLLYSSQVVNIAQSNMNERKKANELAATLRIVSAQTTDKFLAELGITREQLAGSIRDVEIQTNMFDALDKAQPLVDLVASYSDHQFDNVETALEGLIQGINERMDARWAPTRANAESLLALQGRTIKSYVLLYQYRDQYREKDSAGLEALRVNDRALQNAIGKDELVTEKEFESTETQIMARLANLRSIREQLMPQIEQYQAEARERDELFKAHREIGRKLRTTMMLWARSHRNLAKGIPVPPEIDLYSVLVGSAKKFSPVPVP